MKQTKFLEMLTALNITFQLVSDVVAGKLIQLGGYTVSVSVLFFPFTFIISDILTEVYGYKSAKRVIILTLVSSVLAGTLYQVAIMVSPSSLFSQNEAYTIVLSTIPRILFAGWLAIYTGELVNNYVLARLKVITSGRQLWLRTISSTVFGQGVNTAVFYGVGLSGALPVSILLVSIIAGWTFKILVEVLMTPLVYVVTKTLKRQENIDVYDYALGKL